MLNDEGSVKGKGASIMLPPQGSPFAPGQTPPPTEAFPSGAETAPRDLSPEDVAMMYSAGPAGAMPGTESVSFAAPSAELGSAPDAAEAMSSGLRADAVIPGHDGEAIPAEPEALDSGLRADADLPGHDEAGALTGAAPSAEEQAALEPSSPADRVGGEAEASGGLPPGAQPLPGIPTVAPGMAIPVTTVAGGQALPGLRAFAGAQLQLAENVGPGGEVYTPTTPLTGRTELVKLFVPDGRLVTLWTEIDAVESRVSSANRISLKVARELLDRLATARNYLMNDRANFEEADRQVAEVKYRLARIEQSHPVQQPLPIFLYLLIFMTLIVVASLWTEPITSAGLMKALGVALKVDMVVVWATIVWGGIGGVTGALYGLWVHVARDRDYDPEYAVWYYTNPLMGLILGLFVFIVAQVGLSQVIQGSAFILYFLAWAVGFRQNLAFSLANTILKRLTPEDNDDSGSQTTRAPSQPGGSGKPSSGATTFPALKK